MKNLFNFLMVGHLNTVIRHGLVSFTCAITDFSIFYVLFNFFKLGFNEAFVISMPFAALVGFLGHTFFTFQVNKILLKNFIYFIIQLAISFFIGFSAFNFFIYFGISPEMSKIYQLFCTFWFNFLFGKLVSFRKSIKI
jgi:putative flippase GtrA